MDMKNPLLVALMSLTFLTVAYSVPVLTERCGSLNKCLCSSDYTIMECQGLNLNSTLSKETLRQIKNTTEILIFRGNRLPQIDANMFGTCHFPPRRKNLTFVDLSSNRIQRINGSAFHCVRNLKVLNLNDNSWDVHHHTRVFSSLPELMNLSLNNAFNDTKNVAKQLTHLNMVFTASNNTKIQNISLQNNNIPFISLDLHLPALQYIDLSHNNIAIIHFAADNLRNLTTLNLSYNSLSVLDATQIDEFENLKSLHTLDLRNNKFMCDCDLISVYNWIKNASYIRHKNEIKCFAAGNDNLRGMPIVSLKNEDFVCKPTEAPHSVEGSVIVLSIILAIIGVLVIVVACLNRSKIEYYSNCWYRSLRSSLSSSSHSGYATVHA